MMCEENKTKNIEEEVNKIIQKIIRCRRNMYVVGRMSQSKITCPRVRVVIFLSPLTTQNVS